MTSIAEGKTLELRVETFNTLNHFNPSNPNHLADLQLHHGRTDQRSLRHHPERADRSPPRGPVGAVQVLRLLSRGRGQAGSHPGARRQGISGIATRNGNANITGCGRPGRGMRVELGSGLADRRRQRAAHRLAEGREDPGHGHRQGNEASVEDEAGKRTAADALAVAGADCRSRQYFGGTQGDRDRDRRLGQSLRDRRGDRANDLEEALHEHLDSSGNRRPRRRHSLPGRHYGHAGDRTDRHARQVHDLRGVLGRHAASVECGRRRRDRAAFEVHAAQRQAVRAESVQQHDLHAHRAGLRRQSECGVRVRSGDEEGGHVGSGGRRNVGPHGSGDQRQRHDVHGHRRRPLGSGERSLRQRHRGIEARSEDQSRCCWKITTARPMRSGW